MNVVTEKLKELDQIKAENARAAAQLEELKAQLATSAAEKDEMRQELALLNDLTVYVDNIFVLH